MGDPGSSGSADRGTCDASHHWIHALLALCFRILTHWVAVLTGRIAVRRVGLPGIAWISSRSSRRRADNATRLVITAAA